MQILVIIFLSISISIQADIIQMKDGNIFYGSIVEQNLVQVKLKTKDGAVVTLLKNTIDTIKISQNEKEPKNKESSSYNKGKGGDRFPEIHEPEEEREGEYLELSLEVVSDFIWRGYSWGGDYLARRNNTAYTGVNQYWALQPNLRFYTPLEGFYVELWGNISLTGRNDRDSDLRIQSAPGGAGIDPYLYSNKLINLDPSIAFLPNLDPNTNAADCANLGSPTPEYSNCLVNPAQVKRHKEKNGMWRYDGVFTTFAYEWKTRNLGSFTAGTWWWTTMDKNLAYNWNEYFLWWNYPFLKFLNPQIAFYTQTASDPNNTGWAGTHYISHTVSYTIFEGKFFKIQPTNNIGYQMANDNTYQRSGFVDVTSGLKFMFGEFFVTTNHIYRPDIIVYDTTLTFPNQSGALANMTPADGRVVNPSKIYGTENEIMMAIIDKSFNAEHLLKDSLFPELAPFADILNQWGKQTYQYQKIPRNLFYISFGYTTKI